MSGSITIDGTVLHNEISQLLIIRSMRVVDSSSILTSQGRVAQIANNLAALFMEVDASLNLLIDNTSEFLSNILDGFVDADEEAARVLAQLGNELGI